MARLHRDNTPSTSDTKIWNANQPQKGTLPPAAPRVRRTTRHFIHETRFIQKVSDNFTPFDAWARTVRYKYSEKDSQLADSPTFLLN